MGTNLAAVRRSLILQSFLCILLLGSFSRAESADGPGDKKMKSVSKEDQGARVVTSIARACKLGQPMPLSLTVRNIGDATILCPGSGYVPNCRITVVNRDTKAACEMTAYGKQILKDQSKGGGGMHDKGVMKKGQEQRWTLDVGRCFALRQGSFAVSVAVTFRKAEPPYRYFDVTADDLFFEISK